jgi:hypothetical protein
MRTKTLALSFLVLSAICTTSDTWLAAVLATQIVLIPILLTLRAARRARIRQTLTPPTPIIEMPAPTHRREAA